MARPYRLEKRAISAEQTRRRILDAALDVLTNEDGTAPLEVVAQRAGVTRATVYAKFANKHELLLAVVNEGLDRANVQRVRKALQHRDTRVAVIHTLRAAMHFWDAEYALFSRIKALAAADRHAASIDLLKEGVRRGHIENLAARLAEAGQVRKGLSQRDAAERILMLTSLESYEQLRHRSKFSMERTISTLTDMLERVVLA
jgi:AcrR family transcriptional regulator